MIFSRFSGWIAEAMGSAAAFILALAIVLAWAVTGPLFQFSTNWQLVINTGTTIITFLMVFLIQHASNRSAKAQTLLLDELILSTKDARDEMLDLEELSDKELEKLHHRFLAVGRARGIVADSPADPQPKE